MDTQWLRALEGGLLIGAGVAVLVLRTGHIAGISGVFRHLLQGSVGEGAWRLLFLAGLLLPAAVHGLGDVRQAGGIAWLAVAGLLVGIGTRLGRGCTSGHGVCGLSQGSPRSLVATLVFMATAAITVWIVRHGVAA